MGSNVCARGGPGMGHTVKLINQLVVGITIEAVAESADAGGKSKARSSAWCNSLKGGFADSPILPNPRDTHDPARLVRQAARPKPSSRPAAGPGTGEIGVYQAAHLERPRPCTSAGAQGDGELDHSALHKR